MPTKVPSPNQQGQGNGDNGSASQENTQSARDEATKRACALVTSLGLAGEAVAAPLRETDATRFPATYATPEGYEGPLVPDDFGWLIDLLQQIRTRLEEDPRRGALLGRLREAFGDGNALRLLFHLLFPGQDKAIHLNGKGKPRLTDRQVEVLRAVCSSGSHTEAAALLGTTPGVVNNHLNTIYGKLNNAHNPMQAVARAISMGYLDIADFVNLAGGCGARDYELFDSLVSRTQDLDDEPFATFLKPLAEFGLLLLILGQTAADPVRQDRVVSASGPGVVCELNARTGEVVRTFGSEHLFRARSIAIAPPKSARHGFTAGNLFVLHDGFPQQGLNAAAVVEFTPDGQFVRTFCGGKEMNTRLTPNGGLTFATDGRLLVSSPGLTYAVLVFSHGGASVQRLMNGCCPQICVGRSGDITVTQYSGTGGCVRVFDSDGRRLRQFGETPQGAAYIGVAVDSRGHVFVNRHEGERSIIEEYEADGESVRSFAVPGLAGPRGTLLTMDAQDRLYVPCERTADIKVLSPEGRVIRRIDLGGEIVPLAVAVSDGGCLWVSGQRA